MEGGPLVEGESHVETDKETDNPNPNADDDDERTTTNRSTDKTSDSTLVEEPKQSDIQLNKSAEELFTLFDQENGTDTKKVKGNPNSNADRDQGTANNSAVEKHSSSTPTTTTTTTTVVEEPKEPDHDPRTVKELFPSDVNHGGIITDNGHGEGVINSSDPRPDNAWTVIIPNEEMSEDIDKIPEREIDTTGDSGQNNITPSSPISEGVGVIISRDIPHALHGAAPETKTLSEEVTEVWATYDKEREEEKRTLKPVNMDVEEEKSTEPIPSPSPGLECNESMDVSSETDPPDINEVTTMILSSDDEFESTVDEGNQSILGMPDQHDTMDRDEEGKQETDNTIPVDGTSDNKEDDTEERRGNQGTSTEETRDENKPGGVRAEPVVVTISDDEDEDEDEGNISQSNNNTSNELETSGEDPPDEMIAPGINHDDQDTLSMDEEDDDLMIIQEVPAPAKILPDLEMECEDEPMEKSLRTTQLHQYKAIQETLRLVKQWSLHHRNKNKPKRHHILGSKSTNPPPFRGPLTRPPQPLRAASLLPPRHINVSQSFITARPITTAVGLQHLARAGSQLNVLRPIAQAAPRFQPRINARPPLQVRAAGSSRPLRPLRPQAISITREASPSMRVTQIIDSSAGIPQHLTLPSGEIVQMQNLQPPLLLDTSSGLLLVPPSLAVGIPATSSMTTMGQIRAPLSPAPNRLPTPRITSVRTILPPPRITTRVPIITPPLPLYTPPAPFMPKIISTTSMQTKLVRPSQNKVTPRQQQPILRTGSSIVPRYRPPLVPTRAAPPRATPPQANPPRPTPSRLTPPPLPLTHKPSPAQQVLKPRPALPMPRQQAPPMPRQQAPPMPRQQPPAMPQMETANPISGTQADTINADAKDPNNNKSYPSLAVLIKPCLGDKLSRQVLNAARTELDSRVKALLLHPPAKLTEWLMQQGLLRLEHRCLIHMNSDGENIKYKLGMYSDAAKQPFSGGYVWITECCADKQISVFHGSILESAVYTPGTIVKLIYHWACQTSAQNVLQWVKVSSYYLKNFYTLLRSCCVAGLHEYAPMMGGVGKFVEVGIITLGTPNSEVPANQRPVKIEIVGIFDSASKIVRMKVINPIGTASASASGLTRVQQILWPLKSWVDRDSTILIDNAMEKSTLTEIGFKNVIQTKAGTPTAGPSQHTNAHVMNYLRHVVPKMFQNTLCVLSKSLIQQFLDELSWRELWGSTSAASFDNLIHQLVQMTKLEMDETLITRLNKISLNPFGEWAYGKAHLTPSGIDLLPDSIRGVGSDMPTLESYAAYGDSTNGYSCSPPSSPNPSQNYNKRKEYPAGNGTMNLSPPILFPEISLGKKPLKRKCDGMDKDEMKLYLMENSKDLASCINIFDYYYAESKTFIDRAVIAAFPTHLKCPLCYRGFLTNMEIVRHIASHVNSVGRASTQVVFCEFCLKEISNLSAYTAHVAEVHRLEYTDFPCHICQDSFPHKTGLILHMWRTHGHQEMPYRCECCKYRNSRHEEVVEHFAKEHSGLDQVLCPICLKVFPTRGLGDIQTIVVHLQNHSGKKGKKCSQCVLNFASDMDIRSHIAIGLHDQPPASVNCSSLPSVAGKELYMPRPPKGARSMVTLPPNKKSKTFHPVHPTKQVKPKPKDPHVAQLDKEGTLRIENIKFYAHKDEAPDEVYKCCECKNDILTPHHFAGCFACSKCKFSTSCEMSMMTHNRNTHPLGQSTKQISSMATKPVERVVGLKCRCGHVPASFKALFAHFSKCPKGSKTVEIGSDYEGAREVEDLGNRMVVDVPGG